MSACARVCVCVCLDVCVWTSCGLGVCCNGYTLNVVVVTCSEFSFLC